MHGRPHPIRRGIYSDLIGAVTERVQECWADDTIQVGKAKLTQIVEEVVDEEIESWAGDYLGFNYDDLMESNDGNEDAAMDEAREETMGNLYENGQEDLRKKVCECIKSTQ